MKKPVVVLVGRPNVGKSTLFNRLVGERLAIIDDVPGTTRDRLVAEGEWAGREFFVVDTGGIDPTRQRSQEPLSVGSAAFIADIRAQAEIAMEEADVILLLTDAQQGVTEADREIVQLLRRRQSIVEGQNHPPIILAVNKADSDAYRANALDFYSLGLGEPFPISAIHGTGTGDLLDEVVSNFPTQEEPEEEDTSIKVAIVGKPNAGKSSLLNKLAGENRSIVSPIPGTTRDAIDTRITWEGLPITLIDTAGIRKRGSIEPGVEKYSVLRAMQAIERCDVALLVVDAVTGVTAQDTHIAGYINQAWKSVILVINKWDLIEKDTHTMVEFEKNIRQALNFLPYVPVIFISAATGQRVNQILPMVARVQEERLVRLTTSQLNRILQNAQDLHQPSSGSGRMFRIYYGTQVRSEPPTFLLYCNDPTLGHFTYLRYLENQIRKEYPFIGTPIRLVLKARERGED
ncbi:MAG: ribosome biogenesis GTPase Der [Chloroflexi bacterium]|jgi:GTP-binding protein|nr:ribosome biogenesis GTPase Der [Anaerolineaceae bacterium]NLI45292.1 ribosome biogenesis GTPase Der [Chloroflexota bacterium]HOE34831.1 ribosome biogenesis GTPase Der [Anaerolineaceae bacterium]HOT25268.1 ribosome biogenesis GTPase Der [Anaerolineaceae bacterium]HQH57792.1 ribosome biogenesis GTPase Der [Anaerolineaceae bacterium]